MPALRQTCAAPATVSKCHFRVMSCLLKPLCIAWEGEAVRLASPDTGQNRWKCADGDVRDATGPRGPLRSLYFSPLTSVQSGPRGRRLVVYSQSCVMTFSVSHYATIAQIIAAPPRLRNPPLKKNWPGLSLPRPARRSRPARCRARQSILRNGEPCTGMPSTH